MHGVGGRTIAEAKARLTYAEALRWFEFIRLRGSLHLGRRIECAAALVALQVNRSAGGSASYQDFTPHEPRPEMTPEAFFAILSRGVAQNGES